jgi:hypothetical protein
VGSGATLTPDYCVADEGPVTVLTARTRSPNWQAIKTQEIFADAVAPRFRGAGAGAARAVHR